MSAESTLSTSQFGGTSDSTYAAWHDEHFRPVRQAQFQQMKSFVTQDLGAAKTAREQGDRAGAARALTKAARSRRVVQDWSHLNR